MSISTPPNVRLVGDETPRTDRSQLDSNHLSLPVFQSVRDASKERHLRASRSGSSSDARSHHSDQRTSEPGHDHLPENSSKGASSVKSDRSKEKEREKENSNQQPTLSRSSGGFLLDSISSSNRLSRGSLISRKGSGKRSSRGDSELMVTKRRHRDNGKANSSFQSSPLATEVRHDPDNQSFPSPSQLVAGTDVRRSLSSSINDSKFTGSSASTSQQVEPYRTTLPRVGYDNDPAQIVSMALSLSEGRRRLASGRRYPSTEHAERRVVSTTPTVNADNTFQRRSIAPFMSGKRPPSQSGSPGRSASAKHSALRKASLKPPAEATTPQVDDDLDLDPDFADFVSPATVARVEKAKVYFKLAHEHRRLLQHLPPIRRPGTYASKRGPDVNQKAYNPLQYVRNRKLRIWEKIPINSEAEGWHEVTEVQAWVDAVTSNHTETQHDPMECVRLPPLDLRIADRNDEDEEDLDEDSKNTVSPRIPDQPHSKPSRPRSDWVTHPADLIADAYWLEQGLNKTKIQDRDNNLIYPPDTHFKFSGWRNRTPVTEIPSGLQQPTPPPDTLEVSSPEAPPSSLPELPTFKSAHHADKKGRHDRRRNIIRDTLQPKDGSSSRERSRIRKKLFQDSSDSESSATSQDGSRGRKRLRRKRFDTSNNTGAENDNKSSQSKQSPWSPSQGPGDSSQGSSAPTSNRGSMDHSALNRLFKVDSLMKASPLTRSRTRQDASRSFTQAPLRLSTEHERQPRASTDYDTATAPNSPNNLEWPSIAINLSPPPSRSASPTRRPLSTILHPFQRKPHKEYDTISTADFAQIPAAQSHEDSAKHGDSSESRNHSPMTRGVSPLSRKHTTPSDVDDTAPHSTDEHRHSVASRVSTRSAGTTTGDHSKLRGIFKGGRIAEIVGHEVSRVGDYIWKRDPPAVYKHRASGSEASIRSYDTDSDKEHLHRQNGALLRTPPPPARSRSSTLDSTPEDPFSHDADRPAESGSELPRYNNPNLPSFTSPFQKDRHQQARKQGLLAPEDASVRQDSSDHLSSARRRSTSRSPRLANLPRLNTGAPNTSSDLDRQNTYGFGSALELSRSRKASDQLNSAIGPVTGLTRARPTRSTGDLSKVGTDIENNEPGDVTWREIERAYALLFTSTVKAREIGRRADDAGEEIPSYLYESLTTENKALHTANALRVKRRERHIIAAQNVIKTLDGHSSVFNDKLHAFTSTIVPSLHTQLQSLEDQVENSLTPQVRVTADSAGELSMKLSTTSTLAVKELNDTIEIAFRRKRRGPIRFVRKAWFAGIEWTVVGLLWLIWAVVSIIRSFLVLGRGFVGAVRWLLWVD